MTLAGDNIYQHAKLSRPLKNRILHILLIRHAFSQDSVLSCIKSRQEVLRMMSDQELTLSELHTVKMAGNGGCVGTKYFGCFCFTGFLININALSNKTKTQVLKRKKIKRTKNLKKIMQN